MPTRTPPKRSSTKDPTTKPSKATKRTKSASSKQERMPTKPGKESRQVAKSEEPLTTLFRQIDQEMREMERRINSLFSDTALDWKGGFPLLHGWNLTPSVSGVPMLERFGNLNSAVEQLRESWRRPFVHYEIDEKKGRLVATAEMPGIKKGDIQVEVRGDTIQLRAESGERRYRATMTVGTTLDEAKAQAHFENGILTLEAPLARPNGKGHVVKIN